MQLSPDGAVPLGPPSITAPGLPALCDACRDCFKATAPSKGRFSCWVPAEGEKSESSGCTRFFLEQFLAKDCLCFLVRNSVCVSEH